MPQMVSRAGTLTPPTGLVSVADLLHRYAPDPQVEAEPSTSPVSVGTLLRREGRDPQAVERPVRTRARDEDDDAPRRGSGAFVRRGAIAAGTLLAAGSVLGAAVMTQSAVTDTTDDSRTSGGDYAGEGRLDPPSGQDRAIPTVVDNTAQTNPLDPGQAAPMSWAEVAFPSAAAGTTAPADPSASTPAGGGAASSAASTPSDRGTSTGGGGGTSTSDESNSGSGSGSGSQGGGSGSGSGERSGLGGAVENLGEATGLPVVSELGSTVSGVGDALAGGGPSIVGGLARGLL